MKRCFELAKHGEGFVSPNPLVGAVLVKNGKIIGEGYHRRFGGPHAEVNAFLNAEEEARGATLYCNLEPCCHSNKKTPPCTPLIIEKKVKRVVISNTDPNPRVSGRGIQQLRDHGIEVKSGVLNKQGRQLNRFFFTYMEEGRPFITLKIAQSIDGKISNAAGRQTWLTGPESQRFVHGLRHAHDAVLVGQGTIEADNPQLTVREIKGRNPKRFILDTDLKGPLNAHIYKTNERADTWILTRPGHENTQIDAVRTTGARVIEFPTVSDEEINLNQLTQYLAQQSIISLLVEGGRKVFSSFIRANLIDELIVLQAPLLLGRGLDAVTLDRKYELKLQKSETLGDDLKLVFTRARK